MKEPMTKSQKNNNIRYVIYVLALLIVIATLSFALYSNVFTGKNDIIIDTNDLKFNYNETTNSITIENAYAMTDEEGIQNGGTFTFNVSAASSKEQTVNYAIYLTEESGNTLNSANLRLALLNNQNTTLVNPISYGSLKDFTPKTNSKLLYEKKLNLPTDNDKKDMYVLKYWLANDTNNNTEITKTTTGKKQTATLSGGTFKFKVNVMVNPIKKQVFLRTNPFEEAQGLHSYAKKIVIQNELKPIEAPFSWDASRDGDGSVMAYVVVDDENTVLNILGGKTATLEDVEKVNATIYIQGDGDIMAPEDSTGLFQDFSYLRSFEGLEYLDTSNVTNMKAMFLGLGAAYSNSKINTEDYLIDLDLSSFDTSNVTNMNGMFAGNPLGFANTIRKLNLSSFDTSKVTDISGMFYLASYLQEIDLRKATFDSVSYYGSEESEDFIFTGVKSDIKIIVKNNTIKTILQSIIGNEATIIAVE